MLSTGHPKPFARRLAPITVGGACLMVVGCGSSSPATTPVPTAHAVCARVSRAVTPLLKGAIGARVIDSDPQDTDCRLTAGRVRVEVVSQPTAQAWTEFDTTTSHQDQVFGPGVHTPGQIPKTVAVTGADVAVWISAQHELVVTNASPTRHGTYITVTVQGRSRGGPPPLAVAQAAARATLAVAPGRSENG